MNPLSSYLQAVISPPSSQSQPVLSLSFSILIQSFQQLSEIQRSMGHFTLSTISEVVQNLIRQKEFTDSETAGEDRSVMIEKNDSIYAIILYEAITTPFYPSGTPSASRGPYYQIKRGLLSNEYQTVQAMIEAVKIHCESSGMIAAKHPVIQKLEYEASAYFFRQAKGRHGRRPVVLDVENTLDNNYSNNTSLNFPANQTNFSNNYNNNNSYPNTSPVYNYNNNYNNNYSNRFTNIQPSVFQPQNQSVGHGSQPSYSGNRYEESGSFPSYQYNTHYSSTPQHLDISQQIVNYTYQSNRMNPQYGNNSWNQPPRQMNQMYQPPPPPPPQQQQQHYQQNPQLQNSPGSLGASIKPKSKYPPQPRLSPQLFQFVLHLRAYNMDMLFPQPIHDKILVCLFAALKAFHRPVIHRELLHLAMVLKDSGYVTGVQHISKTKVRGLITILKQGEVILKCGALGDTVQLYLNDTVTNFGIVRDRHDQFLLAYMAESVINIPDEMKGDILWQIPHDMREKRLEILDGLSNQLEIIAAGEIQRMVDSVIMWEGGDEDNDDEKVYPQPEIEVGVIGGVAKASSGSVSGYASTTDDGSDAYSNNNADKYSSGGLLSSYYHVGDKIATTIVQNTSPNNNNTIFSLPKNDYSYDQVNW